MNTTGLILLATTALVSQGAMGAPAPTPTRDTRVFEMRTYYAPPGKLDALQARFRNHTLGIFEKHGMQNIGYWVPVENPENKLIYLLAFASREAAAQAWKDFFADPEWQQVQKASETDGRLVAKVDSLFLTPTEFSPVIWPSKAASRRLFELRTYTAASGKLEALDRRFQDHTISLFARHGITSIAYWHPTDKAQGADSTLVYIVAHKDKKAADAAWKAFRADPDWVTAKSASEVKGPLTVPDGVKSLYMTPTDYSPIQ